MAITPSQQAQKDRARDEAEHHLLHGATGYDRSGFRGGMGNLDSEEATAYGERMDKEQSPEETDKDIAGMRSKQPMFRDKSYPEVFKQNEKDYAELQRHKTLQNKIPVRK